MRSSENYYNAIIPFKKLLLHYLKIDSIHSKYKFKELKKHIAQFDKSSIHVIQLKAFSAGTEPAAPKNKHSS